MKNMFVEKSEALISGNVVNIVSTFGIIEISLPKCETSVIQRKNQGL